MNAWNPTFVSSLYATQILGHITTINQKTRVHPPKVAHAFRHVVTNRGLSANAEETLTQALHEAQKIPDSPVPFHSPHVGVICQWLSELGKTAELQGVLDFVDAHLNPTWENGGLYYPRHDEQDPDVAHITYMEPFSGNAAIGYARLNVPNGQKIMWDRPWTSDMLKARPWLDGLSMDGGVDYLRGGYDEDNKMLFFTAATWNRVPATLNPVASNLASGDWAVYVDGDFKDMCTVDQGGSFGVEVDVAGDPVDVVFVRIDG